MRRNARVLALIFIDCDDLKAIDDRKGHATVDCILQVVAQTPKKCLRELDIVGSYGGEEFVAILPGATCTCAHAVAVKVGKQLVMETGRAGCPVTFSMGIHVAPHGSSLDSGGNPGTGGRPHV